MKTILLIAHLIAIATGTGMSIANYINIRIASGEKGERREALAYLRTDAFQQDMRLRPAIERIIACLVRYHGARQADGYGLANADYQAHMAAMAFNLKTWVKLINERRKPRRTRPEADTS